MTKLAALSTLLGCVALTGLACTTGPGHPDTGADANDSAFRSGSRPNLLFFYSDDHAQNAISAYAADRNRTPNIDRLAIEGARFANSFVGNSICAPARATILTGKHSHANGVLRNGNEFDGNQTTFPALLQRAGYQTAVIGKWHLRSEPVGFDHYQVLVGQGSYYNPEIVDRNERKRHEGYTTEIITELALEWLENERDDDRPFLLMVQQKAPHRRWLPGPDQLDLFDDVDIAEPPTLFDDYATRASGAIDQEMTIARHLNEVDLKLIRPEELTDAQYERWNASYGPRNARFEEANLQGDALVRWKYQRYIKDYLRCVQAIDDGVGELLAFLDREGLTDDTVVVYSSDQGFYLGEHGWYDKRWMYEESLRTPMLVRWPDRIQAGLVIDEMVQNIDVAPTFLALAGVEPPRKADRMHGRSLAPLLFGKRVGNWRESIYYRYHEFPGAHSVPRHVGVRTKRYKLIFYDELEEWELFDLKRDPHEVLNVYTEPAYDDVLGELETELTRLSAAFGDGPDGRGLELPLTAR